jgi:type II secretory pathway component PulF
MATFSYRARNDRGGVVTGNIEADSKSTANMQLDNMGLLPISMVEVKEKSAAMAGFLARFQRVSYDDLIFFTRQLRTVIRSGIPLISGLKALEEQASNEGMRTALNSVCQDIDRGKSFTEALSRQGHIFSDLYVSMVRAGETGGSLDDALESLANLLEFQMRTREMLKAALRYPAMVVGALVIAFLILVKFVIPRFATLFAGAKMELPLPTKIMMLVNDVSQKYGLLLLLSVIGAVILFYIYIRTEKGALSFDIAKLKIPLVGPIILKICLSRFANMFESLVKAGVPIIRTLEIVSKTVGNRYIAQKILGISAKIEKGKGISRPIREAKIFPPLVVHLIATGEEAGSLDEMLKEISLHYEREITYSVNRLSAWIEPILTAGLAVMVLFLALAIFLPWWNMMGALKGGG